MKTRWPVLLSSILLTACFEPHEGTSGLGARFGALSLGVEHTLRPWTTGGVQLIEGPNSPDDAHLTFPKHVSKVTGLQCTAPCQLVSGPAADFSYVVRADAAGDATIIALLTLDNGEKQQLSETLHFVELTALDARCLEGACAGSMAMLVGASAAWGVVGKGVTVDGQTVDVQIDDLTVEGAGEAVSLTPLAHTPGILGTRFLVKADAPGSATLTFRRGASLSHLVRVVSASEVTQASFRLAHTSTAHADSWDSWARWALTIDEPPVEEGPVLAPNSGLEDVNIALVGTTADGTEVLGNALSMQLTATPPGAVSLGQRSPQEARYTTGDFSSWATLRRLEAASAISLEATMGLASAHLTLPPSP